VILACLLHDIAVGGLISSDHGYWGAQLLRPYVDEEVHGRSRSMRPLRYFPDESVGYTYPELISGSSARTTACLSTSARA